MTKAPVQLPLYNPDTKKSWYGLTRLIAVLAAIFCLFIAGRTIFTVAGIWSESPLVAANVAGTSSQNPLVIEYQQRQRDLVAHPKDDKIKDRIRQIDHILRQRYFTSHASIIQGAYLLLVGFIVLLLSVKASTQWGPTAPGVMTVFAFPADPWRAAGSVRIAIAVAGCALIAGLIALQSSPVPYKAGNVIAASSVTQPTGPSLAEFMSNWPSFRGPQGCGITTLTSAPTDWDGPTNRNIAWKSPIPLPGKNSPIVWGNKLFLSGATEDKQEVYCFNADTGALLWKQPVTGPVAGSAITVNDDTGYAPATLATDGARVYAIFPTADLAAFDFSGKPLWSKNLGKPDSTYGFAASLAIYRDRLIIQFDQGADPTGKSALIALDGPTGNQLWKTRRNVANSWASPIVIYPDGAADKALIITAGNPLVIAYDADSGKELWNAKLLGNDVAASPAFAAGKVFVANENAQAAAIKLGGAGDVTKTQVLWTADDGLPDMVSPLATADILLLISSSQTATCYDATTGKKLWDHDMDAAFHASPVLVGKTVYLLDTKGVMHMIEAGATYKELGTAALGEDTSATPAFVPGKIFIRGKTNLYCISAPPEVKP